MRKGRRKGRRRERVLYRAPCNHLPMTHVVRVPDMAVASSHSRRVTSASRVPSCDLGHSHLGRVPTITSAEGKKSS